MQSTRKRKQQNARNRNYVVDEDEEDERTMFRGAFRRSQIWLKMHKKQFLMFSSIILLMVYVYWPPPRLSRHAQHWRDSSYVYKYQEKKIFYQDILSLKRPVRMHPVLLILHGFPTSSYDWRHLIPDLHRKFRRIIIPDMLGLGFSDKPSGHEYSVMEQATIVEELMASLKITGVHVLAHDYGDTVAQELMARSNEPGRLNTINIRSLCLSNGGILPDNHQPLLIQQLLLVPGLNHVMSRLSNFFIFSSRLSSVFGKETKPSTDDMNDFWSITRYNDGNLAMPAVLRYLHERQENKKRWVGALQHASVPLQLIYGPLDPINTPDFFLTTFQKLIPNSGVSVLEGTGHYPHLEDRVGFMKFYMKFLQRVERDFYRL